MTRALVLLQRERRRTPGPWPPRQPRKPTVPPGDMSDEEEGRQIPVRFASDKVGPLVTTVGKAILGLVTYTTAVVAVVTWLSGNRFEHILGEKLGAFQLQLVNEYAKVKDVIPRGEYELRHSELIERNRQAFDRMTQGEERMNKLADRIQTLERQRMLR